MVLGIGAPLGKVLAQARQHIEVKTIFRVERALSVFFAVSLIGEGVLEAVPGACLMIFSYHYIYSIYLLLEDYIVSAGKVLLTDALVVPLNGHIVVPALPNNL